MNTERRWTGIGTPVVPEGLTVRIFGLGGVGGHLARLIALFLSTRQNSTRLVLADGDAFEPHNASRMVFRDCGNKARVVRDDLLRQFPESPVTVLAVEEYLTQDNAARLIPPGGPQIVCCCVDNHYSRKLLSDVCALPEYRDIVVISGGNDPADDERRMTGLCGNVQVYVKEDGRALTPSIDRFHPEIAEPQDRHPSDLSCIEAMESTPQTLAANVMVASLMLNTFYLSLCGNRHLPGAELFFDIAEGLVRPAPSLSLLPPPDRGPATSDTA